MASNATVQPWLGWDQRDLAVLETSFRSAAGTAIPNPVAAQYVQFYDVDMGPIEQPDTRAVKDKTIGRGITGQYVSGQVKPTKWKAKTSAKTRTAVDAVPTESALYQAAGLVQTINGGTSVVYTPNAGTPLNSLALYHHLGGSGGVNQQMGAEQGIGGILEEFDILGCDKEVTLDISGLFGQKFTLGRCRATVANGTNTAITADAPGDEYALQPGWYTWDTEIVQVTAVQYGSGTFTVVRGALASTAAAHTATYLYPYIPVISAPTYAPISEATVSCTIDGVATLITSFSIKLKTGVALLPHESGSQWVQGMKEVRYSIEGELGLVMKDVDSILIGKANQRKIVNVTVSQGTGVGGIWSMAMPTSLLEPFQIPSPANDISMIKLKFKPRDNAGTDMFSITLT